MKTYIRPALNWIWNEGLARCEDCEECVAVTRIGGKHCCEDCAAFRSGGKTTTSLWP